MQFSKISSHACVDILFMQINSFPIDSIMLIGGTGMELTSMELTCVVPFKIRQYLSYNVELNSTQSPQTIHSDNSWSPHPQIKLIISRRTLVTLVVSQAASVIVKYAHMQYNINMNKDIYFLTPNDVTHGRGYVYSL